MAPPGEWNAFLAIQGDAEGTPLQGGPDLDFGTHPDASPGFDGFDEPFLASPGQELLFFFRYPESAPDPTELITSKIPPPAADRDILTWPVRIQVELAQEVQQPEGLDVLVTMTWNIDPIPPSFITALLIVHDLLPANQVVNMGSQGTFQFILHVPQGDDRARTDATIAVSKSYVQAMPLYEEWNLVAMTVVPDSSQPADIFTDVTVLSVLRWDPDAEQPPADRRRRLTRATDFADPMIPGIGFWVFAVEDSIQLIAGDLIMEHARGPSP